MYQPWERRKILIWGKTRPELSKTYKEIVCTGGVFADTKRLVRLYPIPLRFMDDDQAFKKYQWIEVSVCKAPNDVRPESYKIDPNTLVLGDTIATMKNGNWDARAEWIMQPENIFQSVEALQYRQQQDKTSLGLVRPESITSIFYEPVSLAAQQDFKARYEELLQQMELPIDPDSGRVIRPLQGPQFKFRIQFRCADLDCRQDHTFGVRDWELDALYFKLVREGADPKDAAASVVGKLHEICGVDKDLHFYLGNISNHPQVFTIVGLWWPKKKIDTGQQAMDL
jgi:hypothetical protein